MPEREDQSPADADAILQKIARDFERLDHAIDAALRRLQNGDSPPAELAALRRAQDVARKGASLARGKTGAD